MFVFFYLRNLAGSIDFVAIKPDKQLVLFDWKRTKDLHLKYVNSFQNMKGFLSHLPDCSGIHYQLQLNLYRYILQTYYGVSVHSMFVVGCHPQYYPLPFVHEVPVLEAETAALVKHQHHKAKNLAHSAAPRDYRGGGSSDDVFEFMVKQP